MISDSASVIRWRRVSGEDSNLRQMAGSVPGSPFWLASASKPFDTSQSQRVLDVAMAN
jgi:hypothetical protein